MQKGKELGQQLTLTGFPGSNLAALLFFLFLLASYS